jgi:hypothetical protein
MHIILVRVVHSIQNSCIKYSTQDQHVAEMFTYSDNTNYNFIVSIYLGFHLFGNYSYVSDAVMTQMEFSRAEYSADHSALFRRNSRNLRYRTCSSG